MAKGATRYLEGGGHLLTLTGSHFRFLPIPIEMGLGGSGQPTDFTWSHNLTSHESSFSLYAYWGGGTVAANRIILKDPEDPDVSTFSEMIPIQLHL